MTDLLHVLPEFTTKPFSNLLPSLERSQITVADILTSDAIDLAKRAQLPSREIRRLGDALLSDLHAQLGLSTTRSEDDVGDESDAPPSQKKQKREAQDLLQKTGADLERAWGTISTLDQGLDAALSGGIPTGYVTEVTGESGAGKTQLLLTLLAAVQLPPPIGLSRSALYISTEAPLSTQRLSQMLSSHPQLKDLDPPGKPSLSRILSISTPDLESQDHILRYQVPVAVRRHNVGLIVIDSITANFRAEQPDPGAKPMSNNSRAARTIDILALGTLLRHLAQTHDLAIVVANQVADRFRPEPPSSFPNISGPHRQPSSSHPTIAQAPLSRPQTPSNPPSSSAPNPNSNSIAYPFPNPPQQSDSVSRVPLQQQQQQEQSQTQHLQPNQTNSLSLDHQQRFFTGWGDMPSTLNLKTPSLGLVWSNQIACRIALVKRPSRPAASALSLVRLAEGGRDDYLLLNTHGNRNEGEDRDTDGSLLEARGGASRWKRHFRVVFAAWAEGVDGGEGVEVEIGKEGMRSVR